MIPSRNIRTVFLLIWVVFVFSGCGGGGGGSSSSTGSVAGTVSINGVARAQVEVRLVSVALNTEFKTTTDNTGSFSFPVIAPGKYYAIYTDQLNNEYTEPETGKLAPRDVYLGSTTRFDIIYTADEMPPAPPGE
ncbi:MAG TPA: carboxypeptidase-like regulatory domain-containing protein [Bacillota bacterium]|nr:carboxypeptidase-like regulatory domain-containing protein [Bacillota bacterium]